MAGKFLTPPISCLPVSLYKDFKEGGIDAERWSEEAEKIGLDAVDLNVFMLRKVKARLRLPVDTVAAYTDFTHPDKYAREEELAVLKYDLKCCEAAGAKYLRITAGQLYPQISIERGTDLAEEYLKRAAELAKLHKVTLLFENHSKPGVWRHYDFAGKPEVYYEMVRRVKNSGIKLLFDTANAVFYGQEPVGMLEGIFKEVKRVHVADILKDEALKPVLIGTGCVPLKRIFKFLKQNNYSGGLSIEEASLRGMGGLKKAVENTMNLWRAA